MTKEILNRCKELIDIEEIAHEIASASKGSHSLLITTEVDYNGEVVGDMDIKVEYSLNYDGYMEDDEDRINPPLWVLDYFEFAIQDLSITYTDDCGETLTDITYDVDINEEKIETFIRNYIN